MKGLGDEEMDNDDDDQKKAIGTVNPIEDFKSMISDRRKDRVSTAITQMRDLIEKYIRSSIDGDLFDKAIECLIILRESCISEDEAPLFNKFMQ